jgi:hypothetical protein
VLAAQLSELDLEAVAALAVLQRCRGLAFESSRVSASA